MPPLAHWIDIAATAPFAFLVGALVGFVLANRYRITKRNGTTKEEGP